MRFPVDQHANNRPATVALIGDNKQFSYLQLAKITIGIAQELQKQGVKERIAIVIK